MESTSTGWWHRHGWTVAILVSAFGVAFAIRSIWAYPVVAQWGALYTYGGGSDSYYHSRVMQYIVQNHRNLIFDPLLNFPIGAINPREPLFDWMNAILGLVFAPFFGGNSMVAGAWFLDLQAPLWAALGVFPIYLIGREVADRRMGLIAAMIYPFLSGSIDSSIFGYANYLSFYTFIILVTVYSYIRTVKSVGSRRWVEDYRHPRQYWPALKAFLRTERSSVKWSVFTGVSLGALALAWQGYTYAVVVLVVSLVVGMVIERIRRVDSFGFYVTTAIVGLVGFPMAMPYYLVQRQFTTWFDLPLLLFFGALALLLPFLLMRDVPWVFSVPLLAGVVAAGVGVLFLVDPTGYTTLVTGQGYFVKNLIYQTVAEAQAPTIDQLVLAYGIVTFFLAFVGLALFVYLLVRGRFKRHHIVFLVFALLSLYLPVSAAKFFLVATPIFALLPAEAIRRALDIAGYGQLRRTAASLSDRRSQFSAFRKAFKPRHVLVMALVIAVVLPNVWVAIDAGIPGNTKAQYSAQVGATIPSWLQLNTSNPSSYYLGAVGGALDTPDQYDSAGYTWLAQQDANLPPQDRPAFVSWWDYGFQAIDQGDHPSVADNFQHGIDPAGQFLLSQNESLAIADLTTTLLSAEQRSSGQAYLPASLNRILAQDGLNLTKLHNYLVNTSSDYNLVVNNPQTYLPVDPSTITKDNAMYLAMNYFLASSLTLNGVAKVYDDVQAYTGWSIRYAMTDSRLFPFSGSDTGIFYAPADLTGRVIGPDGQPTSFYNLSVLGSDGSYYPYGKLPAGVTQIGAPVINYFAPFYDSMIYRIYIGYNGTDIGQSPGIPGLSMNSTIEPGWMLQHFEIVYKTAYLCSQPNYEGTCVAGNQPGVVSDAARQNGSADTRAFSYFTGGETMLEYYPGQTLLGTVELPNGAPVGGARVTVLDGWSIPHQSVLTAPDGSFSVVLPPGNDTLNISMGPLEGLSQQGISLMKSVKLVVPDAVGLSFNAPSLVETYTIQPGSLRGFVYWQNDNTTAYTPSTDTLIPGAQVVFWGSNLTRYSVVTDASGSFQIPNVAPGQYTYAVLLGGHNYTQSPITVDAGEAVNATAGLKAGSVYGIVRESDGVAVSGAVVTLGGASGTLSSSTTSATGVFHLGSVGPGNYTVNATVPASDLRSSGLPVQIVSGTTNLTVNLTVVPSGRASFALTANGVPAAGIPVRFSPITTFDNFSARPVASLLNDSQGATVIVSSGTGTVTAYLPSGNYSVYAVGTVKGQMVAAVGSTTITAGETASPVALTLAPAVRLSGTVTTVAGGSGNRTAVIAYASTGEVVTWATGGVYSFLLPNGTYSLLALQGPITSGSGVWAALGSVTLSGSTSLSLTPVLAERVAFTVGAPSADGSLYPAAGSSVAVRAGPNGPAIPAVANDTGGVVLYVPGTLPMTASSYCLSTTTFGFSSTSQCNFSPAGLAALSRITTSLDPVPTTITVEGLPSGTSVTVNLTAESATAVTQSLSGGPTFALSLPPGVYSVSARAVVGAGTVVYLPPGTFSTTVPLGGTSSQITILLLAQVNATGTLSLPSGVSPSSVTVSLTSPTMSVELNGSAFQSGFRVAPGTYSAYVTAALRSTTYASLVRVSVAASGAVTPTIVLTAAGPTLSGTLVDSSGATVLLNTSVTLVGPQGAAVVTNSVNGSFSIALDPSTVYAVFANGTTTTSGSNGSFVKSWSAAAGATCATTTSASSCQVRMVGVAQSVWLNGTLAANGVTGPAPGTIRLVGPYPSLDTTMLSVPSGTFSVPLLPGAYSLYATGSGSAETLAAVAGVLVLPSTTLVPIVVALSPTWTDTVTVTPPSTGSPVGPVTLTVTNALGAQVVYSNQALNSPLPILLPLGTYSLRATAQGTLGGVTSNASSSASVSIVGGNVGTVLPLAYATNAAVTGAIVGPTSATVTGGSSVTFAFTVRDTGNVPVTVQPVGTPSYWTFNFSFSNVTLEPGPTGSAVSGEVRLVVPAGTAVAHPGVMIEFTAANGTVLGEVTPSPTITVVGYYGVAIGASTPGNVTASSALLPFYVANTGNQGETVVVSVADSARLSGLGWSSTLRGNTLSRSVSGPLEQALAYGANITMYVNLTATSSIFVPPQSVTVTVSVLNTSGGVSKTLTLSVPVVTVHAGKTLGSPPLTVTGPSVGSAPNLPPDWLVPFLSFVPTIALVVGVLTYRWWRTRRWTRR